MQIITVIKNKKNQNEDAYRISLLSISDNDIKNNNQYIGRELLYEKIKTLVDNQTLNLNDVPLGFILLNNKGEDCLRKFEIQFHKKRIKNNREYFNINLISINYFIYRLFKHNLYSNYNHDLDQIAFAEARDGYHEIISPSLFFDQRKENAFISAGTDNQKLSLFDFIASDPKEFNFVDLCIISQKLYWNNHLLRPLNEMHHGFYLLVNRNHLRNEPLNIFSNQINSYSSLDKRLLLQEILLQTDFRLYFNEINFPNNLMNLGIVLDVVGEEIEKENKILTKKLIPILKSYIKKLNPNPSYIRGYLNELDSISLNSYLKVKHLEIVEDCWHNTNQNTQ